MASVTLSYSETSAGWPSFYSYIPEKMIGMNNYFYSFNQGKLYRHNVSTIRNEYYGVRYSSSISSVFNPTPLDVKVFKTLALESDTAWSAVYDSDMHNPGGSLDVDWFVQKETDWFSFLRSDDNTVNFSLRSANGLGNVTAVDNTDPALTTLTFTFNIGSIISVGDMVYYGGTPTLGGSVENYTSNVVTIDTTVLGGSSPVNGDFICYIKNSVAESHGVRGHYLEYTLTNHDTTATELFAVKSSVFKSYP